MPSITVRPQSGAPLARFFVTSPTATDIATAERGELSRQSDGSFSATMTGTLGRASVWAVAADGRVLDRAAYEGGDRSFAFDASGHFGELPASNAGWVMPVVAVGVVAALVAVVAFSGNRRD